MAREMSTGFDSDIYNRALNSIAHGALTNSKRPECLVKGIYPTHLREGRGAFVWDTGGKKYVDFICGLGSCLLGYANEEVNQAMIDRLKKGSTLSLGTEVEIECAEKVKEIFPFVERVRFLKTGSEACLASLRIARAYTKNATVYSHGYHGWGDEFTSLTEPAIGVPRQDHVIQSDWPAAGIAAQIIEPFMTDISDQRKTRLREIRKRCDETSTPLIFDEIITGFRFPRFSAANYIGIEPDLICLGKAMANGMPLSVVAGRSKIMECDEYFVSSTFAGETLSLAAALKTMTLLQTKYRLDHLWEKGSEFMFKFNSLWSEGIMIEGYPTRGVFRGDPTYRALFFQEACKAGMLFGPSFFFNFSHIDLIDPIIATCKDILNRIRSGSVKLEGQMPKTPYAQKAREI